MEKDLIINTYTELNKPLQSLSHININAIPLSVFDNYWSEYKSLLNQVYNFKCGPTNANVSKWLIAKAMLSPSNVTALVKLIMIEMYILIDNTNTAKHSFNMSSHETYYESYFNSTPSVTKLKGFIKTNIDLVEDTIKSAPVLKFNNGKLCYSDEDIIYMILSTFYRKYSNRIKYNIEQPYNRREKSLLCKVIGVCLFLIEKELSSVVTYRARPTIVDGVKSIIIIPYIYEQIRLPYKYSRTWVVKLPNKQIGSFITLPYGCPHCEDIVEYFFSQILTSIQPSPIYSDKTLFVYTNTKLLHIQNLMCIFHILKENNVIVDVTKSIWCKDGDVWL